MAGARTVRIGSRGEDGGTLRDGPDVAGKMELPQIVQEFRGEAVFAPKVFNILLVKMKVFDVADDLLQPGGDGEAAPIGDVAEEHVEVADAVLQPSLEIAVAHGQLVKVGEHGVVDVVFHWRIPPDCDCPYYKLS